jgi:hypothetical protein
MIFVVGFQIIRSAKCFPWMSRRQSVYSSSGGGSIYLSTVIISMHFQYYIKVFVMMFNFSFVFQSTRNDQNIC